MTEKEKMIEEMAKDIHNAKKASDYHCYEDEYTDCKKCKFLKYAENKMCQDAYEACWLIEDGYRKVPEGAVVLTKEELETHDKEVSKKTAEEFATNFENNLCDVNTDYCTDDTVPEALFTSAEIDTVMDRTLKDFGVEVE